MDTTPIAVQLVEAFEATWLAIQRRHPDVPPVVITLGSGTLGVKPGRTRLGHFAADRWQHGESEQLAELFISGEGLRRDPTAVLGTLLHEATHGLAHVLDNGMLTVGGGHQYRYRNNREGPGNSVLVPHATRRKAARWRALARPSTWPVKQSG